MQTYGYVAEKPKVTPQSITLIIGRKDDTYPHVQKTAHGFATKGIKVSLIEHDGGHIIPKDILQDLLTKILG